MKELLSILIESNTINFLILICLFALLAKLLMPRIKFKGINDVRDEIKNYVEESLKEKEHAEENLKDIEHKLEILPEKIERINKSTQNSIKSIEKQIKKETEEQKNVISSNAARLLELETKKFKSKLIGILSEKSIETAIHNAENSLKENPELHNKYIDEAISDIDRISL